MYVLAGPEADRRAISEGRIAQSLIGQLGAGLGRHLAEHPILRYAHTRD